MTFPANELARVSTVKSEGVDLETSRDFERFLRESGFSRSRAKAITSKGFGGFESCAEEAEIAELVEHIEAKRHQLEQKGWFVPLARWIAGVIAGEAASAGIKAGLERLLPAIERPRDRATTPMPITLKRGGEAKFYLRTRLDQETINFDVAVAGARTGEHLFECKITYTEWRRSGPTEQHVELSNLKGRPPKLSEQVRVGGSAVLKACLDQANEQDLKEYRSGLESGKYQPWGEIKYFGHFLADHEDFDAPKNAKFIIRDRG